MLGDFVKKHIYDSGDKPAVAVKTGSAVPMPGAAPPAQATGFTPGGVAPVNNYGIDPQMKADVEKVIERRPSAFSTLEQNAQQLDGLGLDELMRTKAAFKMMKGVNAQTVISSIDLHIRDIEAEKSSFGSSAQQASQRKVGSLRSEAEQLLSQNNSDEATIKSYEQQIADARQRIADRSNAAHKKTAEANQAEVEIQQTLQRFNAAADSVISTLNTKKTQLSSMLT